MKATLEFNDEETMEFRMAANATKAHAAADAADLLARDALKSIYGEDPAVRAGKYADVLGQIRDELRRTVAVYKGDEE